MPLLLLARLIELEFVVGALTGGRLVFMLPPERILLEELDEELTPDPMVPPERILLEELDEELTPDPMVPPERI